MEKFVIQGGTPLSGEITAAGNKNAALPILAACLLTEEEVVLTNVPRIRDTESQVALLERPRREGELERPRTSFACRPTLSPTRASTRSLAARIRASFLLAGPLLARFGEARMPPPGGDFIGRRRLDPHLDAFARHGRTGGRRPLDRARRAERRAQALRDLHGRAVGDGDRERADGGRADPGARRRSRNAACEPHVQDLARLLVKMGAQIDGIGSNVMTVHGRDKLGGAEHRICADHIEVASFMALAAATGGELRIRDAEPDDLMMIRRQFRRLGLQSDDRGQRRARPARAGASRSGPTSATRSRRSRTGPGPRSRPT